MRKSNYLVLLAGTVFAVGSVFAFGDGNIYGGVSMAVGALLCSIGFVVNMRKAR